MDEAGLLAESGMPEQGPGRAAGDRVAGLGPVGRVVGHGDECLAGADEVRGGPAEGYEGFAHRRYEDQVRSGFGEGVHRVRVEQVPADRDHHVPPVGRDVHA
ncbi:hypothetical protein GCM10022380_88540 [Amycolatopsis tucumanensis]|uniref:Uncharacterized protein n=1 Tax=Amycolatopsis tucumanensis TaxID=401106 RepID=A0ABP7JWW1_9PSEU